jgi:serine/threonine protein kinase
MYLVVYKAIHKKSGVIRMIKAISKVHLSKEENKRFIIESRVLKEFICSFLSYIGTSKESTSDEEYHYIVSECATYSDLFNEMITKPLTEEDVAHIGKQLFSAVSYFHSEYV